MTNEAYRGKVEEAVNFYDEDVGLDYFEEFLDDGYVLGTYGLEHLRPENHEGVEEVDPFQFLNGMTIEFQGYEEGEGIDQSFYQRMVNGGVEFFIPPGDYLALEVDPGEAHELHGLLEDVWMGEEFNPQMKYESGNIQFVFFDDIDYDVSTVEAGLSRRLDSVEARTDYPGIRVPFSVHGDTLFDEVEHSVVSTPLSPDEFAGFSREDAELDKVREELDERKELFRREETDTRPLLDELA